MQQACRFLVEFSFKMSCIGYGRWEEKFRDFGAETYTNCERWEEGGKIRHQEAKYSGRWEERLNNLGGGRRG